MDTSIRILLLLCIAPLAIDCSPDYYWRDWNGTVPSDAFVAGTDSRGLLYLAQAYVYKTGLFVGHILSGQKSISLNPSLGSGPVVYSDVLKVFCSTKNTFLWIPSNKTTTPNLLKYTMPVIGGIAGDNATVYVGKFEIAGFSYIGSVHTDYYAYSTDVSGAGRSNATYEILIHEI